MGDLCVKDGETFLFIGDSITDCGRQEDKAPFGDGYVSLFIDIATSQCPDRNITFINKGIGGNSVTSLKDRWEADVIVENPDWLSVKIGINDIHCHVRGADNAVSPSLFRQTYDYILGQAVEKTSAQLVLIDPFYISADRSDQTFASSVMEIIPEYLRVVHDMSQQYKTRLVKTHDVFQKHLKYRAPETFCPEPVHPNRTGHVVIAMELMDVLTY